MGVNPTYFDTSAGDSSPEAIIARTIPPLQRLAIPPIADIGPHAADPTSAFVRFEGCDTETVSWAKMNMSCTCGVRPPKLCVHARVVIREGYDRLACFRPEHNDIDFTVQVPVEPSLLDPMLMKMQLTPVVGHPHVRSFKSLTDLVGELGFVDEYTPRRDLVSRLRTKLTLIGEAPCPECDTPTAARVPDVNLVRLGHFIAEHKRCPICWDGADLVPEI